MLIAWGIPDCMKFRKLRITWTVLWGIACVLLVELWVRSYWHQDLLTYVWRTESEGYGVKSNTGQLVVARYYLMNGQEEQEYQRGVHWHHESVETVQPMPTWIFADREYPWEAQVFAVSYWKVCLLTF